MCEAPSDERSSGKVLFHTDINGAKRQQQEGDGKEKSQTRNDGKETQRGWRI